MASVINFRMRFKLLLVFLFLFIAGCGGRRINPGDARKAIISMPQEVLEKEDIDVTDVMQTSGSEAVAETRVKTAFRLQKENGEWTAREIRIGHGQWEKIGNLEAALNRIKGEETGAMLDSIAGAVMEYRKTTGNLPAFKDYIALSDAITPRYLKSLIRLDAWRNPLRAESFAPDSIRISSSGPDGRFGTGDDISRTVAP
jgi:hypothetical protein